ncbi:MAG TPA: carboxypeptidase-like regulatory domain-containing protein [Gemmataceae bacterium]|nr:carboxypeptidase-like regulatory domain-containing protein [Gemmataceae bacterium]
MNPLRSFPGVLVAGLLVTCTACGPSGPKLHPVRGTVTFNGTPPAGASVVLDPVGGGAAKPSGVVGADGSFTLSTYPHGEGAPAGDYKVLFRWLPENARDLDNPKNKLPARYADAIKTPIPTVTVKDGANDLPAFVLIGK